MYTFTHIHTHTLQCGRCGEWKQMRSLDISLMGTWLPKADHSSSSSLWLADFAHNNSVLLHPPLFVFLWCCPAVSISFSLSISLTHSLLFSSLLSISVTLWNPLTVTPKICISLNLFFNRNNTNITIVLPQISFHVFFLSYFFNVWWL